MTDLVPRAREEEQPQNGPHVSSSSTQLDLETARQEFYAAAGQLQKWLKRIASMTVPEHGAQRYAEAAEAVRSMTRELAHAPISPDQLTESARNPEMQD